MPSEPLAPPTLPSLAPSVSPPRPSLALPPRPPIAAVPTTRPVGQHSSLLTAPSPTIPTRRRSSALSTLRQLLVVVVVLGALGGGGVLAFRAVHKAQQKTGGVTTAPADPFASYEPSTTAGFLGESGNFSATAKPDGSVAVLDHEVGFWLPTASQRLDPFVTPPIDGSVVPVPGTNTEIRMTWPSADAAIRGPDAARNLLSWGGYGPPLLTTWTPVPSKVASAFEVTGTRKDRGGIDVPLTAWAVITPRVVIIVEFRSNQDDMTILQHVWASLTIDGQPVF